MGKAKKRSLHLGIYDQFSKLSREEAANAVVAMLETGDKRIFDLVTLFGLTAEEILEAGASYESVKSAGILLK